MSQKIFCCCEISSVLARQFIANPLRSELEASGKIMSPKKLQRNYKLWTFFSKLTILFFQIVDYLAKTLKKNFFSKLLPLLLPSPQSSEGCDSPDYLYILFVVDRLSDLS
jgi:hypothetical protein